MRHRQSNTPATTAQMTQFEDRDRGDSMIPFPSSTPRRQPKRRGNVLVTNERNWKTGRVPGRRCAGPAPPERLSGSRGLPGFLHGRAGMEDDLVLALIHINQDRGAVLVLAREQVHGERALHVFLDGTAKGTGAKG